MVLSSCIKEKLSTNTVPLTPEYSIPLGEFTGKYPFSILQADSIHPGPFGFIKIDGKTYPNLVRFYDFEDQLSLDFENTIASYDKIISLTLRVIITTTYPTESYAQVYFLGNGGIKLDSIMSKGFQRIDPAVYGEDNILVRPFITLYTIPLSVSQIHSLTTCNEIGLKGVIASTREDGKTVYFQGDQKVIVDLGMRIKLKIN
jgi:hypothetical protein